MNLSEIAIKRPVFAWMLMLGMMFFGFICFKDLGIGNMPDVDFPVLSISVTWEGAAPEVMETDVADIIEDAVTGVEGLKEISSTTRQGATEINLEFDLARDIDAALQEVQSKLSQAQQRLPNEIDPPIIQKMNPEDQPIIWIALSTTHSVRTLMEFVDKNVKDRFKTIPGVGEVFLGGYVDPNLRIWIDTQKLAQYELTVHDVISAIQNEHLEIPAGKFETVTKEANVRVMGEAHTPAEFEKIMINFRGGQPMYRPIQLKEVARIEDGIADVRRVTRAMGETSIGLGIRKQRGYNSVAVAHAVKERMVQIRKDLPEGYAIDVNFDSTQYIEDTVEELKFNLILAGVLTSFVCWIFLGSLSSTINILLAIPTSILGTFLILKFAGYTLNTFTLLGLTLSIGIVVDDAIMVLENIVRHRELGLTQREAALKGAKEIGLAAMVATTAIVAIFLPVAFMKGIIGQFFLQFGVTISVAVVFSLIEALTFAPMRCSQYLEVGERKDWFGRNFDRWIHSMAAGYGRMISTVIRFKALIFIGSIVFFIATLTVVPKIRKELMPPQDQSAFMARLKTPTGSSLAYTDSIFKQAETVAQTRPEVRRYLSLVGGFTGGEVNTGVMFFSLHNPKDRPVDPKTGRRATQEELMAFMRAEFNKIPDLKAYFQDLSMRGFAAQRGYPIEFTIRGPELDRLISLSTQIREEMKKSDLFQDVDTDYLEGMPEVRIYPDREKAFARGISVKSIADTINALVAGTRVSKYTVGGRRYDIRIRIQPNERTSPKDLENIFVRNNRGEMVRLMEVVTVEERSSPLTITRRGRERAIGIFSNVPPGKSQSDCMAKVHEITNAVLPEGYRIVLSGSSETFREAFQSLLFALILGILISYMVLASQFNHAIHPVTVLLALPFSLSGAFLILWATDKSLNMFSFIGLLLLMGIVKKNSILLVEFTNQLRERGLSPAEALKQACPTRFRPILMTSVSTIAAAIPPALALGPGAETRIPMALAIIGGVTVSTILTFFVVPAAYMLFLPLEKKDFWLMPFRWLRRTPSKS
ncbi:MAG: efflux RND transporter permease subunit [Candidatus Omnitrophica bacterium]|nr:efflux RND transporter permease subunit [Candidatus Omnitrophota bacterium]